MSQPILTLERRRVAGPRRFDFACELFVVCRVDSLQPVGGCAADFMVFEPGEGHPSRRKMNPVGFQIPVPARLAVGARTLGTAGARARTVSIHVVSVPAGAGGAEGALTLSAATRYGGTT